MLVFYVTAAMHFDYTPDGTYIYLQYGKNIAHGDGFAFNAGLPSNGVTAPLWTLLISAGVALGLDPYIVAKTFDLVFGSIAIALVYMLTFLVTHDKRYAVLAAVIVSFDSWLLRWAGTGMESSFAVVLTLLCFLYTYRNEYHLAALAAGLLTLVRPEGALLFLAIQVDNFLNTTQLRPALRSFLLSSGIFALVVLPWILFSVFYFGAVLPETAATASTKGSWVVEFFTAIISAFQVLGMTQALCLAAAGIGFVVALQYEGWKAVRLDVSAFLWVFGLPLAYAVLNIRVVSRYLLLIVPLVVIYGLWGSKKIGESRKFSDRSTLALAVLVTVLSVGVNQYVYRAHVVPHMSRYVEGMNDGLRSVAYWLREHTNPETTVLASDIGLVGYVSERRTLGINAQVKMPHAAEAEYIVDRSPEPQRLASDALQPVMTKEFSSMSVTEPGTVYYTLYKVAR